jgi:NPCBM/NEW2 domain
MFSFFRPAFLLVSATLMAQGQVNITTRQVDLAHTALNSQETLLTPASVSAPGNFGVLFSQPLDGEAFATPLYMSGVKLPNNSIHNIVYIATENDSIYAFDADNAAGSNAQPLWHDSLLPAGTTSIPSGDLKSPNIFPVFGITSTPVIDPSTNTLYTITNDKVTATTTYQQFLHALDLTTGAEKFGGPVAISTTFHGVGGAKDGAVNGVFSFDPLWYFNRPALVLYNSIIYACFAGHSDLQPYHGVILGFNASTLALVKQFIDTPNDTQGGIWMSGTGPAIDSAGNMYVSTGNGGFDQNSSIYTTDTDWGESMLKLPTSGTFDILNAKTSPANWFTPNTYSTLNAQDLDLGSSGFLLLPDQSGGSHPHLMVTAGKAGTMYVIDRDNLGGFNSVTDDAVQEIAVGTGGVFCTPSYFNGNIYYDTGSGPLSQRAVGYNATTGGYISTTVNSSTNTYDRLGEGVFISASGTSNGLCWILSPPTARLDVYNATNVSGSPIYSYTIPNSAAPQFNLSIVANGKAYLTAFNTTNHSLSQLYVFGLLPVSATYVSDLPWVQVANGYGPVEKDTSNGEQAAGDGHTISIRGTTFAKGLGCHALSQINVPLNGLYSTFSSSVGIDDEVKGLGSVDFQVFADGTKIYDSGTLTGTSPLQNTGTLNVAGVTTLKLIVNVGTTGSFDHADWAGAQVTASAGAPPPATATNLAAKIVSSSEIDLSWTDTATNATGYEVWSSVNGGTSARIAQLAATATSYANTGLTANTSYAYFVRTIGASGSSNSSLVNATTPPAPGATVYVSDLPWVQVANGYGPVEKDTSNGEQAAGDGHTISIRGTTFAKGLGCHALSQINVPLNGLYSTFSSSVGIDDEVKGLGSVDFQVFADGTKIYDSGTLTGTSPLQNTGTLKVAGVTTLKLIVNVGTTGSFDHADWAGAQVHP